MNIERSKKICINHRVVSMLLLIVKVCLYVETYTCHWNTDSHCHWVLTSCARVCVKCEVDGGEVGSGAAWRGYIWQFRRWVLSRSLHRISRQRGSTIHSVPLQRTQEVITGKGNCCQTSKMCGLTQIDLSDDPKPFTLRVCHNDSNKKVNASHILYWALGPELTPVYRQSACRWL